MTIADRNFWEYTTKTNASLSVTRPRTAASVTRRTRLSLRRFTQARTETGDFPFASKGYFGSRTKVTGGGGVPMLVFFAAGSVDDVTVSGPA